MRVTGHARTRTDHGTVVCLDPRIVTKPYGKLFIESLPDCRRTDWNVAEGNRDSSGQSTAVARGLEPPCNTRTRTIPSSNWR